MKTNRYPIAERSGRSLCAALLTALLIVFAVLALSVPLEAQQVEVEFESVTVEPGDKAYFRILLHTNVAVSGARIPLLLPSIDLRIDSLSFRYSAAQGFTLHSDFNNNNRREFINVLPEVGNDLSKILPPGGEICRVYFEVDEFAPAGEIPIDTFVNTFYVGELRIDERLDISDEFGRTIRPDFRPGEVLVERTVEQDTTSTDEGSPPETLPTTFTLRQNYPNPFNPYTRINFSVPYSSNISLVVYDGVGREVEVLAEGTYPPGPHYVEWDASEHPSGIYFYRLNTPEGTISRKMVVIK